MTSEATVPVYLMEDEKEAARLEKMAGLDAYQAREEVSYLEFRPGHRVLDAGCGSGVITRYMVDRYPGVILEGCDISDTRIAQARQLHQARGGPNVRYFVSPIERIDAADASYDRVICRYVFEFLPDPQAALREFRRVLRPGGELLSIQFDGVIFNLCQRNPELKALLGEFSAQGTFDGHFGRKMPALLMEAGFRNVDWEVKAHAFKGAQLAGELEQTRERLGFSLPFLAQSFGSVQRAERFRDLYCEEMAKPDSVLFYNKFLVKGVNP